MRGHITKRSQDSYSIVLDVGTDPATGRRKQQRVTVQGTKKDAEKRLAELLHQLDTGAYAAPGKVTLAQFLERWLKEYAIPNLSPRTSEGYESIIRQHLVPKLGNTTLTQLKPEHIQKYYADSLLKGRCNGEGGLSPLTVRHHAMVIHRALQVAVKWGLLSRNPADAIDPPHFQRADMHIMTEGDIEKFLEAARNTEYYVVFYLALFTGMRRSEFLALRWSDIDLIMGQVSVSRSIHQLRDNTLVFRSTKTAKGRRNIALPPSAIMILREHYNKQKLDKAMLVGKSLSDNDLVFSNFEGKPLLPDTVSHAWANLVKRVGLAGVRLHDARHTHASLMLKQGIHPKIVQERLGHASISTTLDIYSHVAQGLQQTAAERFDEGFSVSYNNRAENVIRDHSVTNSET